MKPLALSSSTNARRNATVSAERVLVVPTACRISHEATLDQTESGMGVDELGHRLPDPGCDLQIEVAEHINSAHHARMLERAGQEQVVRRSRLDADAHAFAVDVVSSGDG
jgi:hypothetical protein